MLEQLFSDVGFRAVVVAATCNAACALVGCFLVLRRLSLMGDALSHAVLPGLVIAFLVTGSSGPTPMLLGALGAGLLTTFLTQMAQHYGRVSADASLGVVFTSMFALGVVLVKRFVTQVHFDIQCVYEGSLMRDSLSTYNWGGVAIPESLLPAVIVLVIVLGCIVVFWKELLVSAFDPALAESMRLSPKLMHYLLMLLVSFVSVTSFKAVGSILVVAMLIAPAAAAHLLTDRLRPMLTIAVTLAIASSVVGYLLAEQWDVSPAGMMAVVTGLFFILAVVASPKHGVLSKAVASCRVALRVRREDLLSRLYRHSEMEHPPVVDQSAAHAIAGGGLLGHWAVSMLVRRSEAKFTQQGLVLTDAGQQAGATLVRAHRLWESYLVEKVGIEADHVHDAAHMVEHFLDEGIREKIAKTVGDAQDPHGREIPGGGSD